MSSKIVPVQSFVIKYYKLNHTPTTHGYIRYDGIIVKCRLGVIKSLLESVNNTIKSVITKTRISGVHNIVYSHLLFTTNSEPRYVDGHNVREYGLIQMQDILTMWYNFLSSNLDGFFLDSDSVIQLERLCETNINRLIKTVKDYEKYVTRLFEEQKKVNKYKMLRWIQKHTIGKGYTPSFIKVDIDKLPIIKYKWDFSTL